MTKVVARHVWEDAKERINAHRLTERGKRLYARRKETVERSFADGQGVARASLCAFPGTAQGAGAVPAGCRRAEHEEDRATAGAVFKCLLLTQRTIRRRQSALLLDRASHSPPYRLIRSLNSSASQNNKPRQN